MNKLKAVVLILILFVGVYAQSNKGYNGKDTSSSPNTYSEIDARHAEISIQGGWWSAEIEWKSPSGIYSAVGFPWAAWLIAGRSADWLFPFGIRLGYQYGGLPHWKFRGAAHLAGTYGSERTKSNHSEITSRLFQFIEIGTRYEYITGIVMGLDVPVFGFDDVHELINGKTEGIEFFFPPICFAFAQVYVGYTWQL